MRLPSGTSIRGRNILRAVLQRLQISPRACNPYIADFITAGEIPESELTHAKLIISVGARPPTGHSRIYNKSLSEVSVLTNEVGGARDIVLQLRGGGFPHMSDTHRSSDALHFVLLHPYGHEKFRQVALHAQKWRTPRSYARW